MSSSACRVFNCGAPSVPPRANVGVPLGGQFHAIGFFYVPIGPDLPDPPVTLGELTRTNRIGEPRPCGRRRNAVWCGRWDGRTEGARTQDSTCAPHWRRRPFPRSAGDRLEHLRRTRPFAGASGVRGDRRRPSSCLGTELARWEAGSAALDVRSPDSSWAIQPRKRVGTAYRELRETVHPRRGLHPSLRLPCDSYSPRLDVGRRWGCHLTATERVTDQMVERSMHCTLFQFRCETMKLRTHLANRV